MGLDAVIADDVMVNRRILAAHLGKLGVACREAVGGAEAVVACRQHMPDVVFLDVMMPGVDGLQAARAIRALPGGRRVPVVLLTGMSEETLGSELEELQILSVIQKPARADSLAAVLGHLPGARGLRPGTTSARRTRVLVVDDSALLRRVLAELLSQDPELHVVGTARDAEAAWQAIQKTRPDVLTLDVEMPGMDGVTFLGRLMKIRPMPVVMVSSLTERDSDVTIRALEAGAVDYMAKPKGRLRAGLTAQSHEIIHKVKLAARARLVGQRRRDVRRPAPTTFEFGEQRLIVIGASTGGPQALSQLIQSLPRNCPPMVVVQHMPASFTGSFARRLDQLGPLSVAEASDHVPLLPGKVWIAPGDAHVRVVAAGGGRRLALDASPPVNRHRPSVDVLFDSAVASRGAELVGVLLTGMGADGAAGLGRIRAAGGVTIAQDEDSCVVYGMPRAAVEAQAAMHVLPLERIPSAIVKLAARPVSRRVG